MAEKPREIVDAHMHLWSPETRPWLEDLRKEGHPAGKFGEALSQAKLVTDVTSCLFFAESVATYLLEEYLNDVKGYNVTHAVHVEAAWPGDPVGETK